MRPNWKPVALCLLVVAPALVACGAAPEGSEGSGSSSQARVQPGGVHREDTREGTFVGCDLNADPECSGTSYDVAGSGTGVSGGGGNCVGRCLADQCDNARGSLCSDRNNPGGPLVDCYKQCVERSYDYCASSCR